MVMGFPPPVILIYDRSRYFSLIILFSVFFTNFQPYLQQKNPESEENMGASMLPCNGFRQGVILHKPPMGPNLTLPNQYGSM